MVGSGQDEKLLLLKDEFGMEGYGVYWSILEVIAAQISQQNHQSFVELSLKSWRKVTEFSPKKFHLFAVFCQEIGLFSVTFTEKKIKIDCTKLLKYKDEYTRKSGHTPDLPPDPKSGATPEEDIDTDIKKETDINIYRSFDEFWSIYPKKENKKKARKVWEKISIENREKAKTDAATRYDETDKKFIPLPTTYLNGERWEDERESETDMFVGAK